MKKNLNIQVLFCFIDCQTDKIMLYFSYNLIDLLGEASTQTQGTARNVERRQWVEHE